MIRTSYNRYKRTLLLYLTIIIIGIITGIIYCQKLDVNIYQSLIEQVNSKKICYPNFYHILFLFLTVIGSLVYVGPFFSLFNAFLEGFGIGTIILSLVIKKKFKGMIFGLLFTLFNKFLYLIMVLLIGILSLKFVLNKKESFYSNYMCLKISLVLILISIINETILSNIANRLCLYFSFLIK